MMKLVRVFKKDGRIWQTIDFGFLKDGSPDILTCVYFPEVDGPLPENTIIEDEEDSIQEESKSSKENTLQKHQEEYKKGSSRRPMG